MTLERKFGNWVTAVRQERGWTQEELARRSGLSVRGVSAIEQGVNRNPRLNTVQAIQQALGASFFDEVKRYGAKSQVPA